MARGRLFYGWWVELTGGYGAAFTIASVQLLAAAIVSRTIDEGVRCVPRLRPVAGGRQRGGTAVGLEVVVPRVPSVGLATLLDRLAAAGLPSTLAMVDNVLQGPGATPPAAWRDVRLRTPAGVVTLRRVPSGVAVVIFGNADEPLRAAQRTIAETLLALH